MKVFYPFLLLLLVCTACADNNNAGKGTQTANATDVKDTVKGTPGTFYKRFSGTVGNRHIVLNMELYRDMYFGSYYDLATNRPVKLIRNSDAISDNHYLFIELGSPSTNGKWELTHTSDGLKGTRTGADNSVSEINLKEEYSEGSYRMAAFALQDTGRLFMTRALPKATADLGMVWPSGTWPTNAAYFVQSRISVAMDFAGKDGVEAGLKKRTFRYFSYYRNELKSVVDSTMPDEKLADMAYHYTTTFYHNVVYNDNSWLVLENATSNYTGGAHGLYNSLFQSLDMKNNRDWRVNQVITDTASLKPYLEMAVRDYFGIKSTEDLSSRLLTNEVPATANFYITPAGLTFVYNPYELASYSDGEVHLFIPYNKLMNVLTQEFKTRMNFNPSTGVALNASQKGNTNAATHLSTNRL